VGLKAGLRRDLWTAVQPDLRGVQPAIDTADRRFARLNLPPRAVGLLVAAVAERYRQHPGAATFRFIVSPLVTWIWLGGILVGLGALVAAWPAPRGAPRRVSSAYRARLEGELGRA
jgi:cytochrome c-type biogenesis protein CcmF